MRKIKFLTIFILTIFILTSLVACKPKELPKYSNVIESTPEHILDIVETIKERTGTFIFDSSEFGTDPNTYLAITHSESSQTMVTVGELAYGEDDELIITLIETTASSDRDYSIIKIEDYTGEIVIESEQNYEPIDTKDLYFSSIGSIHSFSKEDIIIGVDNYPLTLKISDRASNQIEDNQIDTNDDVLFEYEIEDEINLIDVKKIVDKGEVNGVFVGYMDSHTVEIEVGEEYNSYQISPKASKQIQQSDFDLNQEITFEFIELENGQRILKQLN
ncbi:MAG: hypothetical protein ACLFPS_03110 [Clostridia bacterium]